MTALVISDPILVVDDDDSIRKLVVTVLGRSGYRAAEARNGEEAIELIRENGYAAVLLDLMMPVKNGYEVLEFLEEQRPERDCVIVMTAAGPRATEAVPRELVHAVLFKPFELREVLEAVDSCVRRREGGA